VAFSDDGQRYAEVRKIKSETVLQVYRPASGYSLITETNIDFDPGINKTIRTIGFSPNRDLVYVASQNRLKIFDASTGHGLIEYDMSDTAMLPFAWNEDGILLVMATKYLLQTPKVIRLVVGR